MGFSYSPLGEHMDMKSFLKTVIFRSFFFLCSFSTFVVFWSICVVTQCLCSCGGEEERSSASHADLQHTGGESWFVDVRRRRSGVWQLRPDGGAKPQSVWSRCPHVGEIQLLEWGQNAFIYLSVPGARGRRGFRWDFLFNSVVKCAKCLDLGRINVQMCFLEYLKKCCSLILCFPIDSLLSCRAKSYDCNFTCSLKDSRFTAVRLGLGQDWWGHK